MAAGDTTVGNGPFWGLRNGAVMGMIRLRQCRRVFGCGALKAVRPCGPLSHFQCWVLLIPANVPHGTPVRLAEQARHRPVAAARLVLEMHRGIAFGICLTS